MKYMHENAVLLRENSQQVLDTLARSNAVFSELTLSEALWSGLQKQNPDIDPALKKDMLGLYVTQTKRKHSLIGIESKNETLFTTPAMVRAEKEIASDAKAMAGVKHKDPHFETDEKRAVAAVGFGEMVSDKFGYSPHPNHIEALKEMMTPKSNLTVISGPPGSGKSTLAQGLAFCTMQAHGENAPEIYATAPSGKAADSIVKDMNDVLPNDGVKGGTLQDIVKQMKDGKIKQGSIVVIDEAGLMGAKQSADLLKQANKAGVRLFLFGDAEQMPPEGAGNGFDQMLKMQKAGELDLQTVNLQVVLRQGTLHEDQWSLKLRSARDDNGDAKEALDGYANRKYTADGKAVVEKDGAEFVISYETKTNAKGKTSEVRDASGNKIPVLTPITPEEKSGLTKGLDFHDGKAATFGKLADDYVKFELDNQTRKPMSSVVLASNDEEAKKLNLVLRDKMKAAGLITESKAFGGLDVGKGDTLFVTQEFKSADGKAVAPGVQGKVLGFDDAGSLKVNINPKDPASFVLMSQDNVKDSAKYGLALPMFQAQGQSKDRAFLAVTDKSMDRLSGGVAFTRHMKQMSAYVDSRVYPDTGAMAKDFSNDRTRKKLVYDVAKHLVHKKEKPANMMQDMKNITNAQKNKENQVLVDKMKNAGKSAEAKKGLNDMHSAASRAGYKRNCSR